MRKYILPILFISLYTTGYCKSPDNNDKGNKTYNEYTTNNIFDNHSHSKARLEVIARIKDTKRTTTELFTSVGDKGDIIGGIRFTIKFGKSFEEKRLEELSEEIYKLKEYWRIKQ
ncbi:hypothetical protein LCGC14_1641950 [marine sediment metagenome]|uniref:Uncharacterized protein n=1 Tax=marine sediment metagenome TaxID=412755 RepID=A0A0F9HZA9_9ZZZZ